MAEDENVASEHTKTIVLGGLDGIFTALAVVSGAAGAGFDWQTIVIVGFATVSAGALTTGIGEFLSSKAHKEFVQAEKRRGQCEFKHNRATQIKEMIKLFERNGMTRPDAELVINKMAQYEGFFINLMITEELGLQPLLDDDLTLLVDAFVMFLSYAGFGSIPLIVYCLGPIYAESMTPRELFISSTIITGFCLFILGSAKSAFSSAPMLYSAFESLIFGIVSAAVAFGVGASVYNLVQQS